MALDGDAFGAPSVQLPCLVESSGREYQLRSGGNVVGRQGDISVEDTRVSRRHAQINFEGDSATVEDLGSTNGTKVGGTLVPVGENADVKAGDIVSFGGFEMTFSLSGETNKTLAALSGRTAALATPPTTQMAIAWLDIDGEETTLEHKKYSFGRRADNDIVIGDPYVSGSHGLIEADETGVYLTDTGSTNGTVLNDAKLTADHKTQLQKNDVIKLGEVKITVRFRE